MKTTEQKIRECATLIFHSDYKTSDDIAEIIFRHFGQPERSFEYCDCSRPSHYKGEHPDCIHTKHQPEQPGKSCPDCISGDQLSEDGTYTVTCQTCMGTGEQPDKSLDEIVEKCCMNLTVYNYLPPDITAVEATNFIRQACLEYAAQLQRDKDGWHYFTTHHVSPLPIDTEILINGKWHLAVTYPQYNAANSYNARSKNSITETKGAK